MAAIGILETRGLTGATNAMDAMCKNAAVSVQQLVRPGGGHITIVATGDVASVQSAIEAGAFAALAIGGELVCQAVIPNPHPDLVPFLGD
ncbi:MAG: BMC domain-containing protein [Oscillospiraceae bacterium]